jgi:hypothetical protein
MEQVSELLNLRGTRITAAALSRVQSRISDVAAIVQIRTRAVSIVEIPGRDENPRGIGNTPSARTFRRGSDCPQKGLKYEQFGAPQHDSVGKISAQGAAPSHFSEQWLRPLGLLFAPDASWRRSQQFVGIDFQHHRKSGDNLKTRIPASLPALFELAQIAPAHLSLICEIVLRKPFGMTQATEIQCEDVPQIHIGQRDHLLKIYTSIY